MTVKSKWGVVQKCPKCGNSDNVYVEEESIGTILKCKKCKDVAVLFKKGVIKEV